MTVQKRGWLGLTLLIMLATGAFWSRTHRFSLNLDGEIIELSSRALTVGGALKEAQIVIDPEDRIEPGSFSLLRNDLEIDLFRAFEVGILADGIESVLKSSEREPLLLLAEADLALQSGDRLLVNGGLHDPLEPLPLAPALQIEIRRAIAVSIQADGEEISVLSSAQTVGQALSENGIVIRSGDLVTPALEESLELASIIRVERGQALIIALSEREIEIRSRAEKVGEALAEAGIALVGLDRSIPAPNETIPSDRRIEVVRVEERVEMSTSLIPFSVEWQGDPNTEIDERSVIQAGRNGVQATSERVIYENGVEVSREAEGDWVLSEAQTQISGFGTKVVVRTAVVDGVSIEYWRTLELFATSYSPCRSGVETCYYYTALGDEVVQGIAAVYLSWWYAMGQHTVYVPGYGPAKISDNGAYPDGRPWIDLGYSDEDWVPWAEWVTVYFTTPIPPEHEILYLLP